MYEVDLIHLNSQQCNNANMISYLEMPCTDEKVRLKVQYVAMFCT